MTRYLLAGLVLFVAFAVAMAPAGLVRSFIPPDSDAQLLEPAGTVWRGSASLLIGGSPAGRLSWSFRPVTLFQGRLGYHLELAGPGHELAGNGAMGLREGRATLSGRLSAEVVNRWLRVYDILISGGMKLDAISVRLPYDAGRTGAGSASGSLTWSGGDVRYRLGGRNYAASMPPLVAYLGEGLEAVVYPQDGQTPLLKLEVLDDGFVRIGVTKLMTRLAGNPWPGSHGDHEVVVEVEQQLF